MFYSVHKYEHFKLTLLLNRIFLIEDVLENVIRV